jgi:hypothetical protein
VLREGDQVLIVHRRLFPEDRPRYFVGAVLAYEGGILKVQGFSWVHDQMSGAYARKNELRTKIFSIHASGFLIYQLPRELKSETLRLEQENLRSLLRADGFEMDLTEHLASQP